MRIVRQGYMLHIGIGWDFGQSARKAGQGRFNIDRPARNGQFNKITHTLFGQRQDATFLFSGMYHIVLVGGQQLDNPIVGPQSLDGFDHSFGGPIKGF